MHAAWGTLLYLQLLAAATGFSHRRGDVGTFWHISDLHLDFYYAPEGATGLEICPSSYSAQPVDPGMYGDYRCDSPIELINSSINAMRDLDGEPDFIIWTGDDTLHTPDQNRYLSEDLVLQSVRNITELLVRAFPATPVLASLGNHDYHPKYQMPPRSNAIVRSISDMWRPWMTEEQLALFRETGYGSRLVPNSRLRVIMLNTNMWDLDNENIDGETDLDPANQFEWLESQLNLSGNAGEKVYITGHIGPGFFEMQVNESYYYPRYNERYLEVIKNYSDVIVGQFFGHHHTDSFRMFYDESLQPVSTLFYTPGVTPRIGVRDGSSNPGIRKFLYDRTSSKPLDYTQYFLDLGEANQMNHALWREEYTALREFDIPDLSPTSMHTVTERLRSSSSCTKAETCEQSSYLQRYHLLNTVSYQRGVCDDACHRDHVCAIESVDIASHDTCVVNWKGNSAESRFTSHRLPLLCSLVASCFLRKF